MGSGLYVQKAHSSSIHTRYEFETYTRDTPLPRCWLMASSLLSRDPYAFYTPDAKRVPDVASQVL